MLTAPRAVTDLVFRTSDAVALVPRDCLSVSVRRRLGAALRDSRMYGVLRSADGGPERPLARDIALALLTLQEPGPWPSWLIEVDEAESSCRQVVELVLEGVLEVSDGAHFLSGVAAVPLLLGDTTTRLSGRLAWLSHIAVRSAASLGTAEILPVVKHLYAFNRLPITAAWERELPNGQAIERFLGTGRRLPPGWFRRPARLCEGWLGFERRDPGFEPGPFKLYLSPRPESLPAALDALFGLLGDSSVTMVKIGATLADVLRPDKVMIYADRLDAIYLLAERLSAKLAGMAAQGVPFSAEIAGDGLVSWGVDRWHSGSVRSWRAWLIRRLALAFATAHQARASPASPAALSSAAESAGWPLWRRALEKLRCEGVDVEHWRPSAELWRAEI